VHSHVRGSGRDLVHVVVNGRINALWVNSVVERHDGGGIVGSKTSAAAWPAVLAAAAGLWYRPAPLVVMPMVCIKLVVKSAR